MSSWSSDQAPLGALYRPCGNRRAEVCLSCSRVYARDTFAMIRAGVAGGKTIPTPVLTIRWLREEGRFLPAIKVGRRLLWDRRDLQEWVNRQRESA